MYIIKKNGNFIFSETGDNAAVEILNPEVLENSIKRTLDFSHKIGETYIFADEKNSAELSVKQVKGGCFKIRQSVKNISEAKQNLQLSFSVALLFRVDKYLIPCEF